jgi:hypothetical protein
LVNCRFIKNFHFVQATGLREMNRGAKIPLNNH